MEGVNIYRWYSEMALALMMLQNWLTGENKMHQGGKLGILLGERRNDLNRINENKYWKFLSI